MAEVWLLDTNTLLRMSRPEDSQYLDIDRVRRNLRVKRARVCYTSQILEGRARRRQ